MKIDEFLTSKVTKYLFVFTLLLLSNLNYANAAVTGANAAAAVLCDIILLIRGRIGRALALIAIMTTAWGFMLGHSNWQRVSSLVVGFGLLFGAEGIAYIILPSTIKGVAGTTASGFILNPSKSYTPQVIVSQVCPELARY